MRASSFFLCLLRSVDWKCLNTQKTSKLKLFWPHQNRCWTRRLIMSRMALLAMDFSHRSINSWLISSSSGGHRSRNAKNALALFINFMRIRIQFTSWIILSEHFSSLRNVEKWWLIRNNLVKTLREVLEQGEDRNENGILLVNCKQCENKAIILDENLNCFKNI